MVILRGLEHRFCQKLPFRVDEKPVSEWGPAPQILAQGIDKRFARTGGYFFGAV